MKRNDRSEEIFDFMQKFIAENGYSPTVREICEACDVKSTATAFTYMNSLVERGLINKAGNRNRAVSLKQGVINVPLIGTVAAGQPFSRSINRLYSTSISERASRGTSTAHTEAFTCCRRIKRKRAESGIKERRTRFIKICTF